MRRQESELPADPAELEREWVEYTEHALREIARAGVAYHAELDRDDPVHRGRLSKLDLRLRDWIECYNDAGRKLRQIRDQQLRNARRQ